MNRYLASAACALIAVDCFADLAKPTPFGWFPEWLWVGGAIIGVPLWLYFAVRIWRHGAA